MKHLDDLPKRDNNHEIQEIAETAFRTSISECGCFSIQQEDRNDFGTDFQLEVIDDESATNIRVHVQLKGTQSSALEDGSVSRSIKRANLNYLLQQPSSIYICYHLPTESLLIRYVEDVHREYEHEISGWRTQTTVTVNFTQTFDVEAQKTLKNRVTALAKASRNERILYTSTPPGQLAALLAKTTEKVIVPAGKEQARAMLDVLYEAGKDEIISNSFDQFSAELSSFPIDMMSLYMAEINIAINRMEFDKDRILTGITKLEEIISLKCFETGSLLYSIGNGWLALGEYEKARDVYNTALNELDSPNLSYIAAQCYKNMGSVMEHLSNDIDVAISFYERSLELSPQLSEALFALALCYRQKQEFTKVLEYLDQVIFMNNAESRNPSLQGWRIEALFNENDITGAFREIYSLVAQAGKFDWVWSWCANQVKIYGRDSLVASRKAIRFWDVYTQQHPECIRGKQERLLCLLYMRSLDDVIDIDINFNSFKDQVLELLDDVSNKAFWWDRIGHWAQYDKNWEAAKKYYQKSYELEPEQYGYCLGTALNFLGEYKNSYPMLLDQAENHKPDAMSWFQVAVACEGLENIAGCLFSYHKAIKLDSDYDLAWFNLGGIYWNFGDKEQASEIWGEAIERFPEHHLVDKLRKDLPFLFD